MPLTAFQRDIAGLLAANRSPESHLAGAAALHLSSSSPRASDDLDYFHDEAGLVAKAFAADSRLLEAGGYTVTVMLSQPGFIRAIVARGAEATRVDWAHDSAWRFLPAVQDPAVGYRLHPLDLAVNKVLALVGRDEPRDFIDVMYVHDNYLSLGALCWAAVGKDPGFNPEQLVELLARKGRYHADDFAPLLLAAPVDLAALKAEWLQALEKARKLVRTLPPDDAGCLYVDPAERRFVTPAGNLAALTRHFARRGGVLPSIGEAPALASDVDARARLGEKLPPGA